MTTLATIQRITSVKNHPNADLLDLVQVLGWTVVTKRGEYKVNDLVVYIVIDTVLPERQEFEFLRNKNFRIRPIRLRGEASAGICFPLSIIHGVSKTSDGYVRMWTDTSGSHSIPLNEGDDVTDILEIKHYEKPLSPQLAGQAVGHIPGFLIITDEDNLRTYPLAVPELYSRPYYITKKDDGSSGTYFIKNGEFGVCSRRIHLKEAEGNTFWKMARKYDIENVIKTSFPNKNIAIQGEVVGPGIQGNNLKLSDTEFHIFNIFDIDSRMYLDYATLIKFSSDNKIPMVSIVSEGESFSHTLEELLNIANAQTYANGGAVEGIVVRPKEAFYSTILKKYWSGKVLNELYKEKD